MLKFNEVSEKLAKTYQSYSGPGHRNLRPTVHSTEVSGLRYLPIKGFYRCTETSFEADFSTMIVKYVSLYRVELELQPGPRWSRG